MDRPDVLARMKVWLDYKDWSYADLSLHLPSKPDPDHLRQVLNAHRQPGGDLCFEIESVVDDAKVCTARELRDYPHYKRSVNKSSAA